ncbi:hypothetical protein ABK040_011031 [Willaertia magna]
MSNDATGNNNNHTMNSSEEQEKYIVREGTTKDAEKIISFNLAMAFETENLILNKEIVEKGVKTLLDNPQKGKYYVVEINVDNKQKVVIGSCLVTYEWSDWRCLDYYWLQSVYVDVEHRRKGVFTKLYKHVENICKENNSSLRLYVERTNNNAKQTYTKLGMNLSHYDMFDIDFFKEQL